jgi:hypothetical protein
MLSRCCASRISMSRNFARSPGTSSRPRRAEARFRLHRLRGRGEGGLSHLAGSAHDRSLGLARSRQGGRNRSRAGACLRGLLPHALPAHQHLRELALRPLKASCRCKRSSTRSARREPPPRKRPPLLRHWPPSRTQRAPRVDKDRRPSYVSRAAASLAFFGRFPPVLRESGWNGSMTLRSGAFAPRSKSHL